MQGHGCVDALEGVHHTLPGDEEPFDVFAKVSCGDQCEGLPSEHRSAVELAAVTPLLRTVYEFYRRRMLNEARNDQPVSHVRHADSNNLVTQKPPTDATEPVVPCVPLPETIEGLSNPPCHKRLVRSPATVKPFKGASPFFAKNPAIWVYGQKIKPTGDRISICQGSILGTYF